METFLSIYHAVIVGPLSTFDRLIFKGHLSGLYPQGAFARFMNSQHILLTDFAAYAETTTAASGHSKEAQAVLAGEHPGPARTGCGHQLNGFRNKDLQARLFSTPARSGQEHRRRSAQVTRWIAKLRGHHLITKVNASWLYRVSERGLRLMAAALWCRNKEFPGFVLQPAA